MNKCCEKCFTTYTEHDYPAHTTYDACINLSCPCHSKDKSEEPTTTDWRDRFETQFGNYTIGTNGEAQMFDTFTLYELVEDFIAKERTQAKKEVVNELRVKINNILWDWPSGIVTTMDEAKKSAYRDLMKEKVL